MNDIVAILEFVVAALWRVGPAFLLSVLLGVLVRALKLDGAIRRVFSARPDVAILLATAVGAFSPFCSCTVVPVVAGLLLSGVPLAPVMAFWIASPTMDPEIFALSVATLGWPLAVARLAAALAVSLVAGYLALALSRSRFLRGGHLRSAAPLTAVQAGQPPVPAPSLSFAWAGAALTPSPAVASSQPGGALLSGPRIPIAPASSVSASVTPGCGAAGCSLPQRAPTEGWAELAASWQSLQWRQVGREVLSQSWNLGRWLVLAFVLEALISRYVPQAAIAGVLGQSNPFAVPLAALVGLPLYLNNVSALPIVGGLLAQGMQPGAAIAFLVAGPVTTIPAMTAVWGIARPRVFALYLATGLLGATAAGMVTNLVW